MLKRFVLLCVLATSSSASATTLFGKTVPKSWKSDYVDHFEAGYSAYTGTSYSADATAGTAGDKLAIDAKLTAWVRLFGNTSSIAQVRGTGSTTVNGTRAYHVDVYAWIGSFKAHVWEDDWNPDDGYIFLDDSLERTFLNAEQRFYGVVKVKGTLKGQIGYSVAGVATNTFVGARLTPYVRAYARFTASIDAYIAEGGAYGELNLITASVPIYGNVKVSGTCYSSEANMDAKVTALDGEAGVFYRLALSAPKEKELWSWNGKESTTALYSPAPVTGCL